MAEAINNGKSVPENAALSHHNRQLIMDAQEVHFHKKLEDSGQKSKYDETNIWTEGTRENKGKEVFCFRTIGLKGRETFHTAEENPTEENCIFLGERKKDA